MDQEAQEMVLYKGTKVPKQALGEYCTEMMAEIYDVFVALNMPEAQIIKEFDDEYDLKVHVDISHVKKDGTVIPAVEESRIILLN